MRALLLWVIAAPLAAQVPVPSAFQHQKARALLRNQLACLGCHELEGDGGRTAPSLTTVGARRSAAYIRAMIDNPQRVVPGAAMPKVPMGASTRESITAYLSRGAPESPEPKPIAALRRDDEPVASLYSRWCASCHGRTGGGDGPDARYLPPPTRPAIHSSAAQMGARSDDALFDAIAGGGAIMGKSARMPPFGATLSPAQIRSLVAYIRVMCACTGPVWSRDGAPR